MPHSEISKVNEDRRSNVLLVDDDPDAAFFIRFTRDRIGAQFDLDATANVEQAIDLLNTRCYDAALVDVVLPGISGMMFACLVRQRDINIPLAYFTNMDTEDVRTEAIKNRAFYLPKIRFRTEEGMEALVGIIVEMVKLNPCIEPGLRLDNHGFARRLPETPYELPEVLQRLLAHTSRENSGRLRAAVAARAAAATGLAG